MLMIRRTAVSAARTYIPSFTTPTFSRLPPAACSTPVRHLHDYYLVDPPSNDENKPDKFKGPEYNKKKYNLMKETFQSPLMDKEWGTLEDDFGEEFNDEPPEIFWNSFRREQEERLYFKKQIYDMPDLVKFQKPYVAPTSAQVLRFETHYNPGDTLGMKQRKVRMSVNVESLKLSPKEQHKLLLLVGEKYDPATNTFSIESDRYEYTAQNKKWLSDVMDDLIKECKDLTDDFADVPLDREVVKYKPKPKIPESWKRPQPPVDHSQVKIIDGNVHRWTGATKDTTQAVEESSSTI